MNRLTRHHRNGRDLLSQLHEDFNRLLAPFDVRPDLGWSEGSAGEWIPSIDVKEEAKQYIIHADVPGVKASDIDINIENGVLTIKGKRESEMREEKENYLRVERSSGSFLRQLTLPEAIDPANIQAKCHEGVLEITLPKAKESMGRKIKVKQE